MEDSTEETILSAALKNNNIKNKKEKIKGYVASNLYLIRFLELGNRGNTGKQFKEITVENFFITVESLKFLDLEHN